MILYNKNKEAVMVTALVPWALVGYGFIVLAIGAILSMYGFQQRAPNRVADIGLAVTIIGVVLILLPPAVNGLFFVAHAIGGMAEEACRSVYPRL